MGCLKFNHNSWVKLLLVLVVAVPSSLSLKVIYLYIILLVELEGDGFQGILNPLHSFDQENEQFYTGGEEDNKSAIVVTNT